MLRGRKDVFSNLSAAMGKPPTDVEELLRTKSAIRVYFAFSIFMIFPGPSPGEGPLTATKTSAPARGRAVGRRWVWGCVCGRVFTRPPKIHGSLQI